MLCCETEHPYLTTHHTYSPQTKNPQLNIYVFPDIYYNPITIQPLHPQQFSPNTKKLPNYICPGTRTPPISPHKRPITPKQTTQNSTYTPLLTSFKLPTLYLNSFPNSYLQTLKISQIIPVPANRTPLSHHTPHLSPPNQQLRTPYIYP